MCFFEPTWPFYLKFNLSKTIYCLKRTWFLYILWKYQGMFKVLQWNTRLWKTSSPGNSILYALLLQNHIQSHIPNNYKVINKNKKKICNTHCPCISSVWEQYSKILHNMHFDHVIWHHNAFCYMFVWKMSLCVCCDILRLIWTW